MKLAAMQKAFQAGVLLGDPAISRSVLDSRRLDRAARFKIYFDAYRFRLAEFLSNDYPVTRSFLGDERFGLLVESYIEATPSRFPNARDYGRSLPDFMRLREPWSEGRDAIDLARLERALSVAFDAADGPVLPIGRLADISIEDWPHLAFGFHPSVAMLDLAAGTVQCHASLSANKGEEHEWRPDSETILVWRTDGQVFHRAVAAAERLAYLEAGRGTTFGDICTLLEFQNADEKITERVASFLADWFRDGLVSRVSRVSVVE
jgi:hypothetical protein